MAAKKSARSNSVPPFIVSFPTPPSSNVESLSAGQRIVAVDACQHVVEAVADQRVVELGAKNILDVEEEI
jgi:hypothetical protein